MRWHNVLLMAACLSAAEIGTANVPVNAQQKAATLIAERNGGVNQTRLRPAARRALPPLEQALQDATNILRENNSCSRFYFDPVAAQRVLRSLTSQFQIHLLSKSRTGIEMSGNFTVFERTVESAGYRLFSSATINSAGPFFKAKVFSAEPQVPNIGSFQPNTREARVLMLLHELAHLITGANGSWLIPDDGNSATLSMQNTALIETQCKAQILALTKRTDERIVSAQIVLRSNS
jgi:hypothetical protein